MISKIDIVFQATGKHAWCIREGWVNAAKRLGLLNRVFEPRAGWGEPDTAEDDGLYHYLGNPSGDMMVLLGFDWHSQPIHSSARWQQRWAESAITKVLYVHESIDNNCKLFGNDGMRNAALSAMQCADIVVCPDPVDVAWFKERTTKPVYFQAYGVDETVFTNRVPFGRRKPRPFFRGNTTPYNSNSTYAERRLLIEHLTARRLLDLLPFDHANPTVDRFVEDYNTYQIAVAFPSLSVVHSTRVWEAAACGCALIASVTGRPEQDALFQHGENVLYYRNADELAEHVSSLIKDPTRAAALAKRGQEHVTSSMTLTHRLREIATWAESHRISLPTSARAVQSVSERKKTIVVDGVMFQLQRSRPLGISRVWQCLLTELAKSELAEQIVVLDRNNTALRVNGLRYRPAKLFDFNTYADDQLHLQRICDEENAALFVSTYFTWPERTPSALMLHDMIPEVRGLDLHDKQWQAKLRAIEKAFAHFVVSESTHRDFTLLYPQYASRPVYLTPNAATADYRPRSAVEIERFKKKYGITKPYFVLTGMRTLYKNAMLFFRAFQLLENRQDYEIVCTGRDLEPFYRPFVRDSKCLSLSLSDEELAAAFSGALALVYPSQYEGFGLPIIEAQQCRCPVITCRNSSIPEVAGEAAIYVGESDVAAMKAALISIQSPDIRTPLLEAGMTNALRFSWAKTGEVMAQALRELLVTAEAQPSHLPDPVTTVTQLRHRVESEAAADRSLIQALEDLNDAFRGAKPLDPRALGACESVISNLLPQRLGQLTTPVADIEECDGALCYVLGMVLQTQKKLQLALQMYARSMNQIPAFSPCYRRQVGMRVAEAFAILGQFSHARDALKHLILDSQPKDAGAAALLTRIAQMELAARRATSRSEPSRTIAA